MKSQCVAEYQLIMFCYNDVHFIPVIQHSGKSTQCIYVCVFMAPITTLALCARSQDLLTSVSVRMVHGVLSAAGFKGGGKPCRNKTRQIAALQRRIQKTSRT